jgi:hypothetical protein
MQEKGVDSGLSLTIRQPLDNYSAATQQLGSYSGMGLKGV